MMQISIPIIRVGKILAIEMEKTMTKTKATTTQLEPENYALGLTKTQVQDLYVIYMIAIVVFIGMLILGTIGKAVMKAVSYAQHKKNLKLVKAQIQKAIKEIEKQQQQEGIN